MVGTAVEEGTGLRERGDEVLRTDDPAHAPAGQTPVLGETVDDDDRILRDNECENSRRHDEL